MDHSFSSSSDRDRDLLILSGTTQADVDQEAAILIWEKSRSGKIIRPNRALIAHRLASQNGFHWLFGDESDLPLNTQVLWRGREFELDEPESDPTRDRLIQWAMTQPENVRNVILEFLAYPPNQQVDELPRILRLLRRRGLAAGAAVQTGPSKPTKPNFSGTLIAVLYSAIQQSPQTMEQLYQITNQVHSAKRPEAACRQAVRRLMRQNLIQKTLDGYYQTLTLGKEK